MDTSKYRVHTVSQSTSSTGSGKYLDQLPAEGRQLLERFEAWLEGTGTVPSANSRASYKSGVAKALAQPEAELSANQRSYWRRWEQFLDTLEEGDQD